MMNNGQNPYGNYYNPYYPQMPNQMSANLVQQPMNMQRPVASGMGGRSGVKMSDGIRSGGSYMVDPDMYSEHSSNWDSRYGDAYNKYRASRKHYTESKSAADKLEMDEHANEHINDTIATMKEIYKSADPDMRKRMKENVQKLVSEMIV